MFKRFVAILLSGTCAAVMLTSCGDSKAGGTGEFATVFAVANNTTGPLDSDVATWVNATTQVKATPCPPSVPTVKPDDVSFSVTVSPYATPNTGSASPIVTSDLLVTKITLSFTPADSLTPALPALFQTQFPSAGQRLTSGPNSIPVRVVTNDLKVFLQNNLACSGLTYSYRVSVSFDALEITTNRASTINLPGYLTVNFSDFIDK